MNVKKAAEEIGKLSLMKFFPSDPAARSALVGIVMSMVTTDAQVEWLVKRALVVFNEWPGPVELRALFCSKWRPADGVEAHSMIYRATENGGGFPSETPRAEALLPVGREEARKMLDDLKAHPTFRIQAAERKVERAVKQIAASAPVAVGQITQADIDSAVRENREKRGAAELAGERA